MTPFVVIDDRVRARRRSLYSGPEVIVISGSCLHGVGLSDPCGACADDITYLKETDQSATA